MCAEVADLSTELICFDGSYADAGRKLGEVAGESLRRQIGRIYPERYEGKPHLLRRIKMQTRVFERFNRGWIEEIAACADAAGLRFEQLMCMNLPHAILLDDVPEDCTVWACAGTASATGRPMIHSTTDAPPPANVSIRAVDGTRRILGAGRFLFAGHPSWVNDAGLCHGAATGEAAVDYEYREPGLSSIAITRCLAERCSTCEEVVEFYREVYRDQLFSRRTGVLHVFADHDKAMYLEQTADEFRYRMIESEWVVGPSQQFSLMDAPTKTSVKQSRHAQSRREAVETAFRAAPAIAQETFDEVARDMSCGLTDEHSRSVLNESTTVLLSVHVAEDYPGLLSVAWIVPGRPTCTPYVPYFSGITGVHPFYSSGEAAELSERVYKKFGHNDAHISRVCELDARLREKAAAAAAGARKLLKEGREADARMELTRTSCDCAGEAKRFLETLLQDDGPTARSANLR